MQKNVLWDYVLLPFSIKYILYEMVVINVRFDLFVYLWNLYFAK